MSGRSYQPARQRQYEGSHGSTRPRAEFNAGSRTYRFNALNARKAVHSGHLLECRGVHVLTAPIAPQGHIIDTHEEISENCQSTCGLAVGGFALRENESSCAKAGARSTCSGESVGNHGTHFVTQPRDRVKLGGPLTFRIPWMAMLSSVTYGSCRGLCDILTATLPLDLTSQSLDVRQMLLESEYWSMPLVRATQRHSSKLSVRLGGSSAKKFNDLVQQVILWNPAQCQHFCVRVVCRPCNSMSCPQPPHYAGKHRAGPQCATRPSSARGAIL